MVWFLATVVLLTIVPIGAVSGDAIAHSGHYVNGSWSLNPNHLLFEPIGAAWYSLLEWLGSDRTVPDQLILLSVWSGAVALGLFRRGIADLLNDRVLANYATLWMALSSAWLRLLISGEHFMLEMPFMVLSAIATIRYVRTRRLGYAAAAGGFGGVAALFMISNAIIVSLTIGVGLAIWHATHREWRRSGEVLFSVGLASTVVTVGALVIAWAAFVPEGVSFLEWTTTYSGGGSSRLTLAYGLSAYGATLPVAIARAAYGAASSMLDLQPAVQGLRDGTATLRPTIAVSAFLVAVASFTVMLFSLWRQRRNRGFLAVLLVFSAWTVGTLVFGALWDNSDDQFYFQLAICFGLVASLGIAGMPHRRTVLLAVGAIPLIFNAGDVLTRFVLYPRTERASLLSEALHGAGLIVAPGQNDAENVLYFTGPDVARRYMTISVIANRHGQDEGLAVLEDTIRQVLARGDRVDLLDIFDTPAQVAPWKTLRRMQWEKQAVLRVLEQFPVEPTSRRVGPYTLRSIVPEGGSIVAGR